MKLKFIKYLSLTVFLTYSFSFIAQMLNAKNDIANLLGLTGFAVLLIVAASLVKTDISKLAKKIKKNKNEQTN